MQVNITNTVIYTNVNENNHCQATDLKYLKNFMHLLNLSLFVTFCFTFLLLF